MPEIFYLEAPDMRKSGDEGSLISNAEEADGCFVSEWGTLHIEAAKGRFQKSLIIIDQ